MLYMVELDFQLRSRQEEWDKWYENHLNKLLSMPGFVSTQRFRCLCPHPSPYLAMHCVPGPQFFESDAYRQKGGRDATGEWQSLMTNWHRNLFKGLDAAPDVRDGEVLLVTEIDAGSPALKRWKFAWLDNVGLDQTIGRRGIAVAPAKGAQDIWAQTGAAVRAYKPLCPRRLAVA